MTSSCSVDEAKRHIIDDGFYALEDPEIGSKIQEMHEKHLSFDFSSEEGFAFCLENVLLDSRVQEIIGSLQCDADSRYLLAHRGSFAQDPGHIQRLRNGGEDRGILIVHFWPKGSKVTYYPPSHRVPFTTHRSLTNLFEGLPKEIMDSCRAEKKFFAEGALVVSDARTFFEREEKRSYYYVYIRSSLLEEWELKARQKGAYDDREMKLRPPESKEAEDVARLGVQVLRVREGNR